MGVGPLFDLPARPEDHDCGDPMITVDSPGCTVAARGVAGVHGDLRQSSSTVYRTGIMVESAWLEIN
jgi:hypothetical protein